MTCASQREQYYYMNIYTKCKQIVQKYLGKADKRALLIQFRDVIFEVTFDIGRVCRWSRE